MFAPDSVTGFAATPFAIEARACKRRQRSRPSFSSPPTASARACASVPASNASAGAIRKLGIVTTVAHAKPHHGKAVQHFLPAVPSPSCRSKAIAPPSSGRRTRRRARRSWRPTRRRSSPSSPSASARSLATSRLPARANPSRSIFRSRGASSANGWRWSAMPRMPSIRSPGRDSISGFATSRR